MKATVELPKGNELRWWRSGSLEQARSQHSSWTQGLQLRPGLQAKKKFKSVGSGRKLSERTGGRAARRRAPKKDGMMEWDWGSGNATARGSWIWEGLPISVGLQHCMIKCKFWLWYVSRTWTVQVVVQRVIRAPCHRGRRINFYAHSITLRRKGSHSRNCIVRGTQWWSEGPPKLNSSKVGSGWPIDIQWREQGWSPEPEHVSSRRWEYLLEKEPGSKVRHCQGAGAGEGRECELEVRSNHNLGTKEVVGSGTWEVTGSKSD